MFPKDPLLKKKWLIAMKSQRSCKDQSKVCSLHFRSEDFEQWGQKWGQERKYNNLKKDAVPTIFSFSDVTTLINAVKEQKHPMAQGPNSIEKNWLAFEPF